MERCETPRTDYFGIWRPMRRLERDEYPGHMVFPCVWTYSARNKPNLFRKKSEYRAYALMEEVKPMVAKWKN